MARINANESQSCVAQIKAPTSQTWDMNGRLNQSPEWSYGASFGGATLRAGAAFQLDAYIRQLQYYEKGGSELFFVGFIVV